MATSSTHPQVLLATPGSWYLRNTAKAFEQRSALAGLWISDKNSSGVASEKYRRCWPYHLALKPFYRFASQIWIEHATYASFPFWRTWLNSQPWPDVNVVQATMGFATELFDRAEKMGALKVVDCPNSHPTTYRGYWQRECDLWCPGERVPIPQWVFARMNRELERADLVLCPSFFVRDTMILNGIAGEKCLVNPFGVNTDIFKPRTAVPVRPKFVAIGTISVRKGYQYLFRAFEMVKRQLPEAELVVVGDYKIDFRRERTKWEGSFTRFPSLSHPELASLLQTCTAFVFPSLEEGFARVISEAMAAGLPILASYESGATTLVDDGVEGFIVRGRDPQHIAAAMVRVAKDGELCRRLGEAACQKGAVKNTWQDYGDRLLAEYARRLNP
jgi:glycosyltransferase involved in cell wall biosynthesis